VRRGKAEYDSVTDRPRKNKFKRLLEGRLREIHADPEHREERRGARIESRRGQGDRRGNSLEVDRNEGDLSGMDTPASAKRTRFHRCVAG